MSGTDNPSTDPLLSLRYAVAHNTHPIPTTTPDPTSAADTEPNIAKATHLQFSEPTRHSYPLDTLTRFIASDKPADLRSVYFAFQHQDAQVTAYIAAAQRLNEELSAPGGAGGSAQILNFGERLDLKTWLAGTAEESEFIKPLDAEKASAQAAGSADIAAGAAGGIATVPSGGGAAGAGGAAADGLGKGRDPRLQEIYNGERRMGDRNSVLRGIKPTDFSHVRKSAEAFLGRHRTSTTRPNGALPSSSTTGILQTQPSTTPSLVSSLSKKPGRRPEPIILLSPSASSLLRMSNIKSFLDTGIYIPPESTSSTANILHISRLLPSIDPTRPLRFILVDTPDQFKPDYWSRVVAVFTTGQTWQFKSYKWQSPAELFGHALGLYVGWRGEEVPATVKGWGRGVLSVSVDKWNPVVGEKGRWRDREVMEAVWTAVEESMRSRGWGKEGLPAGR